jgi:hypothetical protein
MSEDPRKVWVNAVPHLLGIAALSALLLAGITSDRTPKSTLSRLQRAARHLRVGMTAPEAYAEITLSDDVSFAAGGTSHGHVTSFFDPRRREFLRLHFAAKDDSRTGRYEMLLIGWDASKP